MIPCLICLGFLVGLSTVASEWVELPQVTLTRGSKPTVQNSSKTSLTGSTSISEMFTDHNKITKFQTVAKNIVQEETEHSKLSVQKVMSSKPIILLNTVDDWTETNVSQFKTIKENDGVSKIVKETLKKAEKELLNEPGTTIQGKLRYLHELKHKLYSQIRRLSQGLWVERQARGKKLMGFASMEGALMTIAFLTFAVFLVKVVHQFIQSLQQHELTMTVALPPTATATVERHRSFSRHKREQNNMAAAQLLRYIDEFSIKHRLHCDYP